MWLLYIAIPLVVLAIIASIAGGGIFTIVLVPLAIIAVVAAFWSSASARAGGARGANRRAPQGTGPEGSALPNSFATDSGRAPTTPEALADARREQQ
jgi:hypothetical protein